MKEHCTNIKIVKVMRMPSRIWNLKKKGWFEDGTDHPIQMADAFESIHHHHRPRTYMRKPTTSKPKNTARPPFENSKIILLTPGRRRGGWGEGVGGGGMKERNWSANSFFTNHHCICNDTFKKIKANYRVAFSAVIGRQMTEPAAKQWDSPKTNHFTYC